MNAAFDCWIETVNKKARTFEAVLNRRKRKWLATLSFDDVPEEDRYLIQEGQLFTLVIKSNEDKPLIQMSKLPDWTVEERKMIERKAQELFNKIKFS